MLRALDPDEPRPPHAYRVPWQVDRAHDGHPRIVNGGPSTVRFVRAFVDDARGRSRTELWGALGPGEGFDLCLCDVDLDDVIATIAWFRGDTTEEYVWRLSL